MNSEIGTGAGLSCNRRELLKRSLLLVGGSCLCRPGRSESASATCCFTPSIEPESLCFDERSVWIDLNKAPSLGAVPSAVYIVDSAREAQIIVVRQGRRKFAAFSRLCTHASQVISFVEKRGLLQCNGFNHSTFDLEGRVYKGPAEQALAKYPVELNEHTVKIDFRSPS